MAKSTEHTWTFARIGGVDQVVFRDGSDIVNIDKLDQKLWMALSMPTVGVELDSKTAELIDTDKDNRIRPPELIAAVKWAEGVFKDPGSLKKGGDTVALGAIKDAEIRATIKRLLSVVGKEGAAEISLAQVAEAAKLFAEMKLNGDGVITAESTDDEALRAVIGEIIGAVGEEKDRSGKPGLNQARLDQFFSEAQALCDWASKGEADAALAPLGLDATAAASAAIKAVGVKVDDFFARCRLAAFDGRALAALNRSEAEYAALAAKDLSVSASEVSGFPVAMIEPGGSLPLSGGVNPAWAAPISTLASAAVAPLLGAGKGRLSEADWSALREKIAAFDGWNAGKPATAVEKLGLPRLRELLAGGVKEKLADLIRQDAALEAEYNQITAVEKAVRMQRDLYELVTNFVSFSDFYGKTGAVFQVGTLYLDNRACHLCIDVTDPAKHAALAGHSGAFLAYCDLTRPGSPKRAIVAVFSNGDADSLIAGRNGVFYDRKGQDWDATITRVVSNPVSVREAFWLPYKKLARMIEELFSKRIQAAETSSSAKIGETATAVASADQARPAAPAAEPKKLDLGTIALIGTAIGGVSALVGGFLHALFGLGMWMPLGVLGVVLLISGPSMMLAYLKLRKRNLGPLLDANGWAINNVARMNIPFGASLTDLPTLPPGAVRSLDDPFAEKQRPWWFYAAVVAVVGLGGAWFIGKLDSYLPLKAKSVAVLGTHAPAHAAPPASAAPAPAGSAAR